MREYVEALERRSNLLRLCIEKAKHDSSCNVKGRLQISTTGKRCEYYHIPDFDDSHLKYIPQANISLAKSLASRDYATKVLRKLQAEKRALDRYLATIQRGTAEEVYARMSIARQKLVTPILLPDNLCAKKWEQENFTQSTYMPEKKIYPTKKGDWVRSKTEMLFADMYTDMGIPYRYEEVTTLPSGEIVIPDFTLWDSKRRRVLYHEHFGLMDDHDYRKKSLKKIDDYRRNGIYVGKNLIMTFEGDGAVLNMKEMRAMFHDLLM